MMISKINNKESFLCNIKNNLEKNDLLLVQIKLDNKLLSKYTVSSSGIVGSIRIIQGLTILDIKNSYESVVLKKIKNYWKGKLNIFDIVVKNIVTM